MNIMLPYEEIWKMLNYITTESSLPIWDKFESRGEESFPERNMKMEDDHYMNTFHFLHQIEDGLANINDLDFSYCYKKAFIAEQEPDGLDVATNLYNVTNDCLELRFILRATKEDLKTIVEEFVAQCPCPDQIGQIEAQTIGNELEYGFMTIKMNFGADKITFPLEIQFLTRANVLLNEYLQTDGNKIEEPETIRHALELRNWLDSVSEIPEKEDFKIQSYVDYIYEKSFPVEEDNVDLLMDEDLVSAVKGGRLDGKSKVYLYEKDTNDLIALGTRQANTGRDIYQYIKEVIPEANVEVFGARDIQTLLRTHRELKSVNVTRDIFEFLKDISRTQNALVYS